MRHLTQFHITPFQMLKASFSSGVSTEDLPKCAHLVSPRLKDPETLESTN